MKFKLDSSGLSGDLTAKVRELLDMANAGLGDKLSDLAQSTYAKIHELASNRLNSTRQQFIDSLKMEKVAMNRYVITLDGDAEHIEKGYDSFDMKPGLLRGAKKVSKQGYRYRSIKFDHKPGATAKPSHPLFNQPVQITSTAEQRRANPTIPKVGRTTTGSLTGDREALAKAGGDKGITKDAYNSPILQKVSRYDKSPYNANQYIRTDSDGMKSVVDIGRAVDPNVVGIAKYQYKVGKTVKAMWVTFRTVSENPAQKNKWIHPGYTGAHIMQDVKTWVDDEMKKIVQDMNRP